MKKLIIVIIVLVFIAYTGRAQEANGIQITIAKATYKAKTSELFLEMSITNTGTDTVKMVKPQFNHFDKNYRFSPYQYVSELKKPYTLDLQVDQACAGVEEEEMMMPMQESPSYIHFTKSNLLILAPGESSRKYKIPLNLTTHLDLCAEGQFQVGVSYHPQYEKLSNAQLEKMEKLRKEIDAVFIESHQYLESLAWTNNDLNLPRTLLHQNLHSDQSIKSLTEIQVQSEKIKIDYQEK